MSIERRVERAEKRVGVKEEDRPILIIGIEYGDDDTLPHFPEPLTKWVTLQRAREESQRRQVPCIFTADPFAEYEVRHGLEPGTLADHELCGKVPFGRLLERVIGETTTQRAIP